MLSMLYTGAEGGQNVQTEKVPIKEILTVKINACFYCLNNLKIRRNIKKKIAYPVPLPVNNKIKTMEFFPRLA